MTNITAVVLITITTNWSSIGTLTLKNGAKEDVQQGRLCTNELCVIEYKGNKHELLINTNLGPVICEKRIPEPILDLRTNVIQFRWQSETFTNITFPSLAPQ